MSHQQHAAATGVVIRPLAPFGADVSGVDLAKPVGPAAFGEIEAAFNAHGILIFRNQPISDEQQIAFTKLFGPLEPLVNYAGSRRRLTGHISDMSNLTPDGELWQEDNERRMFNLANQLWHTDSSFKEVPALCSLLAARGAVPPEGGDTEFADLRAAYDALPQAEKERYADLVVEHDILKSRARLGYVRPNPGLAAQLPPVRQRLVRRHPGSGRQTLYLASHAARVDGMSDADGEALIDRLLAFATQDRFVYRHRWQVGDLVIWDNRCTMHRGRPYDDLKYPRILHRTTVSEHANTLVQEPIGASLANPSSPAPRRMEQHS